MDREKLTETKMTVDKPHEPWGQHVDVVVPLPDITGVQKLRIDADGDIVSEDFTSKA